MNELLKGSVGITGLGTGAGMDLGVAETMVFDGAGKMFGHDTAAAGWRDSRGTRRRP